MVSALEATAAAGREAAQWEHQYYGEELEAPLIKVVAIRDHPAGDESQLALKVGDIVSVIEQDESGWWGGHKKGEEFTGWFPGTAVRRLAEEKLEVGDAFDTPKVTAAKAQQWHGDAARTRDPAEKSPQVVEEREALQSKIAALLAEKLELEGLRQMELESERRHRAEAEAQAHAEREDRARVVAELEAESSRVRHLRQELADVRAQLNRSEELNQQTQSKIMAHEVAREDARRSGPDLTRRQLFAPPPSRGRHPLSPANTAAGAAAGPLTPSQRPPQAVLPKEETPQRGCVQRHVLAFEERARARTPRPRADTAPTAALPPAVARAPRAAPPEPRPLAQRGGSPAAAAAAEEESSGDQIELGLSPIHTPPREEDAPRRAGTAGQLGPAARAQLPKAWVSSPCQR